MNAELNVNCPGSLFWQGSLLEYIQDQVERLSAEVVRYSRDFILNENLGETGSPFVLHQRGDRNRELTLTALVFDVPA